MNRTYKKAWTIAAETMLGTTSGNYIWYLTDVDDTSDRAEVAEALRDIFGDYLLDDPIEHASDDEYLNLNIGCYPKWNDITNEDKEPYDMNCNADLYALYMAACASKCDEGKLYFCAGDVEDAFSDETASVFAKPFTEEGFKSFVDALKSLPVVEYANRSESRVELQLKKGFYGKDECQDTAEEFAENLITRYYNGEFGDSSICDVIDSTPVPAGFTFEDALNVYGRVMNRIEGDALVRVCAEENPYGIQYDAYEYVSSLVKNPVFYDTCISKNDEVA